MADEADAGEIDSATADACMSDCDGVIGGATFMSRSLFLR